MPNFFERLSEREYYETFDSVSINSWSYREFDNCYEIFEIHSDIEIQIALIFKKHLSAETIKDAIVELHNNFSVSIFQIKSMINELKLLEIKSSFPTTPIPKTPIEISHDQVISLISRIRNELWIYEEGFIFENLDPDPIMKPFLDSKLINPEGNAEFIEKLIPDALDIARDILKLSEKIDFLRKQLLR